MSTPLHTRIRSIVAQHHVDAGRLLPILHDVMAVEGHVSPEVITELASALNISRGRVEGVVGFYAFFHAEPRGRYRVYFSDCTIDEMHGGRELRSRMQDAFGVKPNEVDKAGLVSLATTSCTGLCDQGPAMLVNGRAIARLTPARVGAITSLIRSSTPIDAWPNNLFVIESNVHRRDLLLTASFQPGQAIEAALRRGQKDVLDQVTQSGLRGRGGAGFATGAKWSACARANGAQRWIVCNADEGEPGTFKDRELLAHHADAVIEGMTVAGFAVGATRGIIYLRAEYTFLVAPLLQTLERRREQGVLGTSIQNVPGFEFDVELRLGAGAYVCGEESALLESLEGKRGIPRNRPPYPVTHGYLDQPTVVNNVETLLAAAWVALHGAGFLRAVGTPSSAGTKIHSVSGDVARPGIYEYPFGTPVRRILDDAGASRTQAVQVGGPSGTLLSATELDRKIAFDDVPSAGALMVFDDGRDLLGIIDGFARFFAHESCGFCTPCRVGTTLSAEMMRRIVSGNGTRRDLKDLERVAHLMKASSHCGLGTTAGNPVLDGLRRFRPTFERRLRSLEVLPTFDLDASLAPAREATGRDDPLAHFRKDEV